MDVTKGFTLDKAKRLATELNFSSDEITQEKDKDRNQSANLLALAFIERWYNKYAYNEETCRKKLAVALSNAGYPEKAKEVDPEFIRGKAIR